MGLWNVAGTANADAAALSDLRLLFIKANQRLAARQRGAPQRRTPGLVRLSSRLLLIFRLFRGPGGAVVTDG